MAVGDAGKAAPGRRRARVERLEARVSAEQKALLQRAAALSGRTLTDFVVGSAQDAAARVIERHQMLELTTQDSAAFTDALLNPPPPSDRLRRAAERYKKDMDQG